jgi:hypothetical protein
MFIWLKLTPLTALSILNPFSLLELSLHDKLMSKHPTAVATRLDGARGVDSGVAVGIGVAVGVGVGVGAGVGVGSPETNGCG